MQELCFGFSEAGVKTVSPQNEKSEEEVNAFEETDEAATPIVKRKPEEPT